MKIIDIVIKNNPEYTPEKLTRFGCVQAFNLDINPLCRKTLSESTSKCKECWDQEVNNVTAHSN